MIRTLHRPITLLVLLSLAGAASWTPVSSYGCLGQDQAGGKDSQGVPSEAIELNRQVIELFKQGKYDEALPLAQRSVELERKLFGPAHSRVVTALNNLAEIYIARQKWREAEQSLREALAIVDGAGNSDPIKVAHIEERIGQLLYKKGDFSRAAKSFERTVSLREKRLGNDSLPLADTLVELANAYSHAHDYDKADQLFYRALSVREKAESLDPKTKEAMKNWMCARFGSQRRKNPQDPALEEDDMKTAIVNRAVCWLAGFEDNCADPVANVASNEPGYYLGVLNGKAIKLAHPPYPDEARRERVQGIVTLAVMIDKSGNVIDAKPVCDSHPLLAAVCVAAARASKFTPTMKDGKAIQVTGFITYNFIAQ